MQFTRLVYRGLVVLTIIGSVALWGICLQRTYHAVTAPQSAPGVAVTTGCEEESLYAIWRVAHGQPAYRDTAVPPYASAYFNWLFYSTYGRVAAVMLNEHGQAQLPVISRCWTFIGALAGTIMLSCFAWQQFQRRGKACAFAAVFIACFCFLGPLPGWWICTTRPDIWALTFELLGLLFFLHFQRQQPWQAVFLAALCFYAAWAMKPNFIQAICGTTLFLLTQRRWRHVLTLITLTCGAYIITLVTLGATYQKALLETATSNQFLFGIVQDNTTSAALRILPILVLCALCLFHLRHQRWRDLPDAARLALGSLPVAITITLLTCGKVGASNNYYFTTSLLLTIAGLSLAAHSARTAYFLTPSLIIAISLLFAVLGGKGQTNLRGQNEILAARWQLWQNAPEPRFSHDLRLNLPWLNPHTPPFVLAFNYPEDRKHGRHFFEDGIGGLISRGYFAALLLPEAAVSEYDGVTLSGYHPKSAAAGYVLLIRNSEPPN